MTSWMNRAQLAAGLGIGFSIVAAIMVGCTAEVRNYNDTTGAGGSSSSSTAESSSSSGGDGGMGTGGMGGMGTSGGAGGMGGGSAGSGGAGGGLPAIVFDEGLATVLRGIEIDMVTAPKLAVAPGYYRLREFRSYADTSKVAVALELEQAYGECSDPTKSIIPRSDHPWVFWQRDSYEYNADHYLLKTHDSFGHDLSFEVLFTNNCFTVNFSTINGENVQLTVQKFTTGELYTCNYPVEPAFTMPAITCL